VSSDHDRLCDQLERRAPREWELYEKTAESAELDATADERGILSRRERGWAARWWAQGAPRFACASSPEGLERAVAEASRIETVREPPPQWPTSQGPPRNIPEGLDSPRDVFDELQRLLSSESRGEARLQRLTARRGASVERIVNGRGLDVSFTTTVSDGVALAVGRKVSRVCEGRSVFRWDGEPDLAALARRLSDRATLPLSDRPAPIERGELLLEPSVAAALLSRLAPLFCAETLPRWVHRTDLFSASVTIADDASADALYDGEGTPTRRIVIVESGRFATRLQDLRSARASGSPPTGHGVRPSYRAAPSVGARRLFFETDRPTTPRELLASVRRGLFAAALTAPARVDFERDRFELEFTGIALLGGRAEGPVAGALARGRLSQLLRRISALSTDRQFFPMPYPVGAPTVLIERAEFE
jgi:PmbA protein